MAAMKQVRRLGRSAVVALVAGVVLLAWPSAAGAHPLGNFTVNRYARVEVSADVVRVYYVLDEAEVPAFQDRAAVTADPDAFLRTTTGQIASNLDLTVDGRTLELDVVDRSLDQPEGEAGLDTLRIAAIYEAPLPSSLPDGPVTLRFEDRNEPDRIGWREVVAVARGDTRIGETSVPDRDVTDELRSYPDDLLQAPLDVRAANVEFVPGDEAVGPLPLPSAVAESARPGGAFAELVTRQNLGVVAVASMLGLAALLGAGHALLPGHGKTVMAAYLVGTKGRPVDAVLLGCIVSFMHTASVLVLGLLLFRVNRSVELERLYPVLTIASGVLAAALGAWLLRTRLIHLRLRRARRAEAHTHSHGSVPMPVPVLAHAHAEPTPHDHGHGHIDLTDHHDHGHDHAHDHGHGHGHSDAVGHGHSHELPEDVAPLSRRGLVVLATSGGIVPSPTAVIVVVSAFSLGRAALGLTLIAAFSVGLAATLTAVGLALVFGRQVVERRWSGRAFDRLPVLGAAALTALGIGLAVQGLLQLN